MWLKWFPWRFIVSNLAKKKGFLDPFALFSKLQRFSQPSEVAAPTELLRSGAIMHARGLMNSQAIQHNLDWIWPYWVQRQFDPLSASFVPRAFSITHINLTHRNWTAVGLPETKEWPIVDPRGLVTPFYDGWSVDAWIIAQNDAGASIIPSRENEAEQVITTKDNVAITTTFNKKGMFLNNQVRVVGDQQHPVCEMALKACADTPSWLVVSLRPYNPEGVNFIHSASCLENKKGWLVNKQQSVFFDHEPDRYVFSHYRLGDVYKRLKTDKETSDDYCEVGMMTTAALFTINPQEEKKLFINIPLTKGKKSYQIQSTDAACDRLWQEKIQDACRLNVGDEKIQFLYDTAVRTLILHSPKEVYPGPYTYKRFWFRDAAFILYALLALGCDDRVKRTLDCFESRQLPTGYFLSQEGEWDSNGEALWIYHQYCQMTNQDPDPSWKNAILKAGRWINHKRLSEKLPYHHAGLLPAGFSAEHLGPNDYYYWDDYWGIAGLRSAAALAQSYKEDKYARHFAEQAEQFLKCVDESIKKAEERAGTNVIPASPYRRLDAGAIGSVVGGYPLKVLGADDGRLLKTVEFLIKNNFVRNGFFQDMTHSGINPYLTLHIAQVLLRAGDNRYIDFIQAVADLASRTGQWPEAVHPITLGGCMGDGQHVWAAAEWILMIRNCFLREEEGNKLILASGIPEKWLTLDKEITFGPASTNFGPVTVSFKKNRNDVHVQWTAKWHREEPVIEVRLPGTKTVMAKHGQNELYLR